MAHENFSLKVANYKCFGDTPQGFEQIKDVNLIIGRNNSGKTALLEMLEFPLAQKFSNISASLFHKGRPPTLHLGNLASEQLLKSVFRENTSGGGIPGGNHWAYGRAWIDKPLKWKCALNGEPEFVAIEPAFAAEVRRGDFCSSLAVYSHQKNPLMGKKVIRLSAERNILPEPDGHSINVASNGQGATSLIYQILNFAKFDRELVAKDLLKKLNAIVTPDMHFIGIHTRKYEDNTWEIFLEEDSKGLISLTHTGSGLKTILLVLILMELVPLIDRLDPSKVIYAFEELENYLHPALQRRLLAYVRDKAKADQSLVFITTHSNIAIDMFSRDQNAQIVHVKHDGKVGNTQKATTYIDFRSVIDDLDIRASDILQANSLIWVEGPSDRIYINHWINLWTNGSLKEGEHYQIVFYGGRLLSHLSAASPDEEEKLINMLRVNSNAAIIIDSDRRMSRSPINKTKKRLKDEIESIGGLCWITNGKEIENYVPLSIYQKIYGREVSLDLEPYSPINLSLDSMRHGEGEKFLRNKVLFAEKVVTYFIKEDFSESLSEKVNQLCRAIKKWNKSPE